MLKTKRFLLLAGLTCAAANLPAYAQRTAPARGERAEQRQQASQNLTPEQRRQNAANRLQERLKSATPEQRQRIEARLQQAGGANAMVAANGGAQNVAGGGRNGGGRNARGGGRGGRSQAAPLTTEQKDAQRRQLMANAGITDKFTQDDIIAFVKGEEKAREPLIRLARAAASTLNFQQLRTASLSNALPSNEKKVENAFTTYQKALAADKIRHEAALKSLDASIGYVGNPRLTAFLTLVGVIDSDALAIGGASAIFSRLPNAPQVTTLPNSNTLQARNAEVAMPSNPLETAPVAVEVVTPQAVSTPVEAPQANPFLQ